jgi:predicted NAD/FAD-binding protein
VRRIVRRADGVRVTSAAADRERFDAVIVAAHSDQAMAMLADPSTAERAILGAIPYQRNEAVLHHDQSLLPRQRRAWAAWNYHVLDGPAVGAAVTYNMNLLQGLESPEPFCVTLNRGDAIDPRRVIARMTYHHPVYTRASIDGQHRWAEISGVNRSYYCGAYWGHGFHEDGVNSALAVAGQLGIGLDDAPAVTRAA